MSADDIQKYLSVHSLSNIHFFHSKFSILFFSESHQKVFKRPLIDNILILLYNKSIQAPELSKMQVLYPLEMLSNFYVYPLLHHPLDLKSIQQCFNSFATSVLHALEELHSSGYAHLDVRIPNICFRQSEQGWQAEVGSGWPPISESSLMFNVSFNCETKYDWQQFSLLLLRVIEGRDDGYHNRLPVFGNSSQKMALRNCFDLGNKPEVRALDICLVKSPKTLSELLPLSD